MEETQANAVQRKVEGIRCDTALRGYVRDGATVLVTIAQ
jgi:hypothetical protein